MNAIMSLSHTARQIALIKSTVAKDCNDDEFNLYFEVARGKGLDPFLGQIIPMIFSKNDTKKRKMTIIISRDGQRVIAQRCGDYRPASRVPDYDTDPTLKAPTNPLGIVSATVFLWKQDPKTSLWYEVAGQAFWDEFAPLSYAPNQYDHKDTGETWPDGNPKKTKTLKPNAVQALDDSGNWARMPRLMIAKCAEMQALRAGWPAQFAGLYDETEMDKAQVADLAASEIVLHEREEQRFKAIGGADAITVTWGDGWALENVPLGQFADRAAEFVRDNDKPTIDRWAQANKAGLQQFWARSPGDAHELKKLIEKKVGVPDRVEAQREAFRSSVLAE